MAITSVRCHLTGQADPQAQRVEVEGLAVSLDAQKRFRVSLTLQIGQRTVGITTHYANGRQAMRTLALDMSSTSKQSLVEAAG